MTLKFLLLLCFLIFANVSFFPFIDSCGVNLNTQTNTTNKGSSGPVNLSLSATNSSGTTGAGVSSSSNSQTHIVRDDLERAVFVADYPLVQALITIYDSGELVAGIPPIVLNRRDERGRTALMKCGFDPQSDNKTLIDITCMHITQLLHQAGADIYNIDNFGWTTLHYAASMGYVEVSKYLLEEVEKETDYHNKKKSSAIKKEHLNSWDSTDNNINVNYIDQTDEKGLTALSKAVANGHYKVVDYLLRAGADVNKADLRGWSPLFYAARNCFHEAWPPILDLLLVNDERSYKNGKTVLTKKKKIDLNLQDYLNRSPLMYASNVGSSTCVSVLLKKGASLDLVDKGGNSALSLASNDNVRDVILSHMKDQVNLWRQEKYEKKSFTFFENSMAEDIEKTSNDKESYQRKNEIEDNIDKHIFKMSTKLNTKLGSDQNENESEECMNEYERKEVNCFPDKENVKQRTTFTINDRNISQLEELKAATLMLKESI